VTVAEAKVHPHVRGDNSLGIKTYSINRGSPPRAWGQLEYSEKFPGMVRFTPTCVGTMWLGNRGKRVLSGSPPRAWGQ